MLLPKTDQAIPTYNQSNGRCPTLLFLNPNLSHIRKCYKSNNIAMTPNSGQVTITHKKLERYKRIFEIALTSSFCPRLHASGDSVSNKMFGPQMRKYHQNQIRLREYKNCCQLILASFSPPFPNLLLRFLQALVYASLLPPVYHVL